MTLTQYMQSEGITAMALAQKLGVSVSTVTRAARGEVIPKPDQMRAIFKATGGKVQPNDFYGIAA